MLWVNDFFCGAGGLGMGFKQAGFRIAGAWDFDRYAVESYGNNVSPKVRLTDVTQMSWSDIPYADVWTFGFPCQDISSAGRRKGMVNGETRSGLFYEIMRLLEETERNQISNLPKVILAENVKGVKRYVEEIRKIYKDRGYSMNYVLYNSKYWGVPQNRERYFFLGLRDGEEFNFPKEVKDRVGVLEDILDDVVDKKYIVSSENALKLLEEVKKEKIHQSDSMIKFGNIYPSRGQNGNIYSSVGISPTLSSGVTDKLTNGGIGSNNAPKVYHRGTIRKMTPRECARLQGFPNDYRQVVSDTQFYKQLGNAVTVPIAKAIAESIKDYLEQSAHHKEDE